MDEKLTLLTWVIGLGGTAFAVLMGVMWSYTLNGQKGIYDFVSKVRDELKGEIDMVSITARQDNKEYETKFARKDELTEVKNTVNAMRGEMSNQFSNISTHMGSMTNQLANVVTILTQNMKG